MYEGLKIFHIVAVISWMACLFYLPRLFIYHVENLDKIQFKEVVKVQEYKLYYYIGYPAFYASIISGFILIYLGEHFYSRWIYWKLFFITLLIFYHFNCGMYLKQLAEDKCHRSSKFFRFYNEVPTLLLIAIIICVVLKF